MRLTTFIGNALCKIWYFNPVYQNYLFQVKILVPCEKGILYLMTDKCMANCFVFTVKPGI